MRKLWVLICCIAVGTSGVSQRIFDTTYKDGAGQTTNVCIFLPALYLSQPSTDSVQAIIFSPGLGEIGSDSTLIFRNGPMQYLQSGWDGSVTLGNGVHHPIIITIQEASTYLKPIFYDPVLDSILAHFRIFKHSVHETGLSQGGEVVNAHAIYQATSSDSSFGKKIRSIVNVEGVRPDNNYDATVYPTSFVPWAHNGGREWGFQQCQDSRDINTIVTTMNGAGMGTIAQYTPTCIGTGAHGYWNYYYGGYLSTGNGGDNTTQTPNLWSFNGVSQNIYQWMLRQGDTVNDLAGGGNSAPNVSAGASQTIQAPASMLTLSGTASGNNGATISSHTWSQVSGPSCTITSPSSGSNTSPTTTVTSMTVGVYVFKLAVTDNLSQTNSSTVSDTVKPVPTVYKHFGVIGSSTPVPYFGSPAIYPTDSGWVQQVAAYYKNQFILDTFYDLAQTSTNVYQGMPTWYIHADSVLFGGNPTFAIDTTRNIDAILKKSPTVVLVHYPTNNYDYLTTAQVMFAFRTIKAHSDSAAVPCFILGTQPRGNLSPTEHQRLIDINDSIIVQFGARAIPYYDEVAQSPGSFNMNPTLWLGYPNYLGTAYMDSVHMNPSGHDTIVHHVLAAQIFGATAPIANAGGTTRLDITQYNGVLQLNATASVCQNCKYFWTFPDSGYYANGSSSLSRGSFGEPTQGLLKNPFSATPEVIELGMYSNRDGDSTHKYRFFLQVIDSVTGLSGYDTAYVVLTYPYNSFPPQSPDANGWRKAVAGDSVLHKGIKVNDILITGAKANALAGSNTNIDLEFSFSNTFRTDTGTAHRIWINAGNPGQMYGYISLIYDTTGSATGPLKPPPGILNDTISYYGQNALTSIWGYKLMNMIHVRFTGQYDSLNNTGNANWRGNDVVSSYQDTMYGVRVMNYFQSLAGFSYDFDGISMRACEFDHLSSYAGNFSGMVFKPEFAGEVSSPSTHPAVIDDSSSVHDCDIWNGHESNYYLGTSNGDPCMSFDYLRFFNNKSFAAGGKSFKNLQLHKHNDIHNNVEVLGAINRRFVQQEDFYVGRELGIRDSSNKIHQELIYGAGRQLYNIITTKLAPKTPGASDSVFSNFVCCSVGDPDIFVGQEDTAINFTFYNNTFGGSTVFTMSNTFNNTCHAGQNNLNTILYEGAGTLGAGATLPTITSNGNTYDSTKYHLTSGTATFLGSGNTLVKAITLPNWTVSNQGFPAGYNIQTVEQWGDSIWHNWHDEYNPADPCVLYQQPTGYNSGDIVHWFGKYYQSKHNNNNGTPPTPGATDANWTLLKFSNGGTMPPGDLTLFANDPYAVQGIGLLQQTPQATGSSGNFIARKRKSKITSP